MLLTSNSDGCSWTISEQRPKLQFCKVFQYILKEIAAGLLLLFVFFFSLLQHTEKFKTIYQFYDSRLMPTSIDKPVNIRRERSSFPAVPGLTVLQSPQWLNFKCCDISEKFVSTNGQEKKTKTISQLPFSLYTALLGKTFSSFSVLICWNTLVPVLEQLHLPQ